MSATDRPRPSRYRQNELARLIAVCHAGTGRTGCGWGRFNTPAGTWSQHTAVMPYIDSTPSPRGADLARQIARGQWRIVGHTRLRGQRAIKLAQTRSGTFHYLPPSKANLAHLRVPIPPGYPRSG